MKKRITQDDYIKANRKASREAEIKEHGHPVCYKRVHEAKKVYNRRKIKAADKKLPYFYPQVHTPAFDRSYLPKQLQAFAPALNSKHMQMRKI